MTFTRNIASIFTCLTLIPASLYGQDDLIKKAEKAHNEYRFQEAVELYHRAAEAITDSTDTKLFEIEQAAILSENGINFLRYVSMPRTLAKKDVILKDIPLWLPIQNGGWVSVPNNIVSDSPDTQRYTFFPEGDRIIYSAKSIDGSFDIFEISREQGTQWSAPEPIAEINTSGNEIYPFISTNGETLWFASDGHPGIGGYDLFVSKWDESQQKWGTPENLGFPYSSTADDLLYFDTPDGNWSVLASTRYSDRGTATIYIMDFDGNPIKTSISDLSAIQKAARLEITETSSATQVRKDASDNGNNQTDGYTSAVLNMRNIQQSYQDILNSLDAGRSEYELAETQSQRTQLSQEISSLEVKASQAKSQLDVAKESVRKAEMDLLKKGIIPPAVELQEEKPSNGNESDKTFHFTRTEPIPAPEMTTRIPEPVFNYTFRIQEETEFAPEEVPSEGLVYQVQMVVLSSQPAAARFKGISPVFVRKSSGKFICSAGAFRSYDEASKASAKVRAKGFSQAFLTAYKDGKNIPVKTARLQEKSTAGQSYNVTLSGYPDGLPSIVKTTISANCTKDLAKSIVEGKVVYIIGPFSSRTEAESLVAALEAAGAEKVSMETVTK